MAKIKKSGIALAILCFVACFLYVTSGNRPRYLGDGFYFSSTNEFNKHIWYWRLFDKEHEDIGVPPCVLSYRNTHRFILVMHKPRKFDDIIDIHYTYPQGRDSDYFWIVIKKEKIIIGPMSKEKMVACQDSLLIPARLQIR